jgi:hypothetical protein
MPKITLRHNPELTAEKVMEIFKKQFQGKYEIYATRLIGADLIIKKSAWTGVSVKLKQAEGQTILKYGAMAPSAGVRMLFYALIPILILYFVSWKKMQNEIKSFVENAPEFK